MARSRHVRLMVQPLTVLSRARARACGTVNPLERTRGRRVLDVSYRTEGENKNTYPYRRERTRASCHEFPTKITFREHYGRGAKLPCRMAFPVIKLDFASEDTGMASSCLDAGLWPKAFGRLTPRDSFACDSFVRIGFIDPEAVKLCHFLHPLPVKIKTSIEDKIVTKKKENSKPIRRMDYKFGLISDNGVSVVASNHQVTYSTCHPVKKEIQAITCSRILFSM